MEKQHEKQAEHHFPYPDEAVAEILTLGRRRATRCRSASLPVFDADHRRHSDRQARGEWN
ncbi:hypothetical protein NTGHW29_150057 [Candidatus Nitrotoga sp. HW29]|nr:hypothetical protein NTGHW29_150057 [Candidatus Nitrotoga sp. HW29]